MADKKKTEKTVEKKVSRDKYEVLYAKNFGKGVVQAGKTVEMHPKAGEFYADQGIVKQVKK
ncbi:hypothetical protein [Christiangramia crocea]|uniref:Uncharacterized protein n=1 Tax=Christiangramia crocea TaxID=2904124 RepID=A0A9X2A4Z2_9FLAO|nr:hypothetical protein [Gramella crocea]MCG9970994.1 hypothetical protein [Gramella crocea]